MLALFIFIKHLSGGQYSATVFGDTNDLRRDQNAWLLLRARQTCRQYAGTRERRGVRSTEKLSVGDF